MSQRIANKLVLDKSGIDALKIIFHIRRIKDVQAVKPLPIHFNILRRKYLLTKERK